ncbi:NmrA-like family protein [Bremerella volcania]|uniref:NmrA-like family protein n=1 Tax=Bremerella volcania TaxID=2527984 RepID=A0A518CET0_9BACT|nr:NAD(P)-binding oxidoreductase [Bremerella volcania]QDU77725.1 NmrA-like family protein [Bremerella volcania]
MTVLVVGATGATGKLLVEQLLSRGQHVRVIVRSRDRLPEAVKGHPGITIAEASLSDLTSEELQQHVLGCDSVASCLGHNLTLQGIFGHPRRLVTDTVRRLCQAVERTKPENRVRFVLMNTAGNQNRDLDEPATFANQCVVGLLRFAVPPHADNEQASDVLRQEIGKNSPSLSWVVVRPDSLVDQAEVTPYELHPSPTRDPIFNAGTTSRINVAHFMAELIMDRAVWGKWVGQMPVIYNCEAQ